MLSRVSYRFEINSSYTCGRAKTLRVDASIFENGEEKVAFSNEYGYVWTGPECSPIWSVIIVINKNRGNPICFITHAMTRTVLLHCPISAEIRTVDSQSDLRILL